MHDLAAKIGDQLAEAPPGVDDSAARLQADLLNDADNVALLRRSLGANDEIGAAQDEEVQGVVLQHERVVDQFPDLPAGRGGSTRWRLSRAFVEAMWCAVGQTPQIRLVICGMSSAGRPLQNTSNPLSSGTCR